MIKVGRVMNGCSHREPVVVPCNECVEKRLVWWENSIREEQKRLMTDEMKKAQEDAAAWKVIVDRVQRDMEAGAKVLADLQADNKRLTTMLRDSKREADDLRSRLHAEQAAQQKLPAYRMVTE